MRARAGDRHDSAADATEWIADATRELAGLTKRTSAEGSDDTPDVDLPALEQLRAAIGQLVSTLPRPVRPVSTAAPGIAINYLALRKILMWALAEPAAEASAAVADIAIELQGTTLAAVHIDVIAVGADEREHTYLDDGDALRARAAATIAETLGTPAPPVTLAWDDLVELDDPLQP
ncbi:hypothetical protein [Segniliparus rugosus]|uniref:Uncharacterized protein n=1 Tax=Segniliparus rugosus (strain ATCC BAA-974 / DSM 45345 / CCUG 50838 / CIP 108380 / JCM 13579 / CDC 945) TaxID=679197 RepID=E5XNH8_SEGRC|nr:hypothetical protein [Segniliparus rugosus]EFV14090.1 hypothetical protein HMPREF9336_01007 [Segniliparus rugosus ATCC BAA-974]